MFVLPKGYEKEITKEDTKQEETEQLSFGKTNILTTTNNKAVKII